MTHRTFWLPARRPAPLDAFRVLVGAALVLHFARHLIETVPIVRGAEFGRVPVSSTPALASAGLLLAVAVTAGVAPRIAAAGLFACCVAMHWAIVPISFIDDAVAAAASLALTLLPLGSRLRARPLSRARAASTAPSPTTVSGTSAAVLLAEVSVLYMSGRLGDLCGCDPAARPVVTLVTRLIPIAFVIPNVAIQGAGMAVQLAVHAYLAATTPAEVTNLILASTALLFWGERRRAASNWAVDGPTAVAIALAAIAATSVASGWTLGGGDGSDRILADLGLLPAYGRLPSEPTGPWTIAVGDVAGGRQVYAVPVAGIRSWLLRARLASTGPSRLKTATAAGLAGRYCRLPRHRAERGTMGAEGDAPSFEFECDEAGGLASLDSLDLP